MGKMTHQLLGNAFSNGRNPGGCESTASKPSRKKKTNYHDFLRKGKKQKE